MLTLAASLDGCDEWVASFKDFLEDLDKAASVRVQLTYGTWTEWAPLFGDLAISQVNVINHYLENGQCELKLTTGGTAYYHFGGYSAHVEEPPGFHNEMKLRLGELTLDQFKSRQNALIIRLKHRKGRHRGPKSDFARIRIPHK